MTLDKFPFYYNAPKSTIEKAKDLRLNLTPTEKILWNILRNGKIEGCKFRRQHPIGPYIADFYAHEVKLTVEADGGIHTTKDQKEYDAVRDEFFIDREITVLRFTNKQIELELEKVEKKIKEIIIELRNKLL